jgi:tetratricopeptide (TPR) repeat protein
MYCIKCGTGINDTDQFCSKCGEKIEKTNNPEPMGAFEKVLLVVVITLGCLFVIGIFVSAVLTSINKERDETKDILMSQALDDYNSHNYTESVKKLNLFLERKDLSDKKLSNAYAVRGEAKVALGDNKGAMNDWKKSLEIYTDDNKNVYADIAQTYQNIGDYSKSIEWYEKAIDFDPENTKHPANEDILFSEASIYQIGTDFKKLETTYNRILLINPKNSQVYADRASLVYGNTHEYDKALKDYTKSLELNPNNAFNLLMKANTEFKLGKTKDMCNDIYKIDITYLKGFESLYGELKSYCK